MSELVAVLTLQAGYNTALVMTGAACLGAAAGSIGTFVLLRKRALVSDAIAHATLPGLALAFLVIGALTGEGRAPLGLMAGAALSAALGLYVVEWIGRRTRLPEDAAIGAVLSVFFGVGVVLMTVIQAMPMGGRAGLGAYLLGASAGMLRHEAQMIAGAALGVAALVFLLRRPFTLVCFDPDYAVVRGYHLRALDLAMLGLLLAVTVIGLRVAGLVLIVALAIIPPVAARFWTNRPGTMVVVSAGIGALAAYVGAAISALDAGLPTGAVIVLVAFGFFVISLAFGPARGLVTGWVLRHRTRPAAAVAEQVHP